MKPSDATSSVEVAWNPRIAIIGAGMSGIATVVKLQKAGYSNVTVFEKSDRVGGTWRENTYPGLSCDVPSPWYSFTFELNPDWLHRYSYGPEIQAYMERTADKYGVTAVTRFNTKVTDLVYDAATWRLTTDQGQEGIFDIVISATGILHHPSVPDIPGLENFEGRQFHTACWDHSVPLEGQRFGIIGSGSTAAQIVGAITAQVKHLTLFQRTPQWMFPLRQKKYSAFWKWLLRIFPVLSKASYWFWYKLSEITFAEAVSGNERMQKLMARGCRLNLEKNVPDPELRTKLTPDHKAMCKRLILCSEFYPAISRDNASLVTEGIERIEAKGVRTKDGVLHELDVLVLATGFKASNFILPTRVVGENGQDLNSLWGGLPRAHRAMSVPGFPNFWMIEGPTGPIGNLSLTSISEMQVDYIIMCLNKMKQDQLLAMASKLDAFDRYNDAMAKAIQNTIWFTGGCQSWYMDKSGVPNLYPWLPRRFRADMRQPDFSEYRLIGNGQIQKLSTTRLLD
ncbi:flavin-containing monooxygenase [Azotobacter armeniacus]